MKLGLQPQGEDATRAIIKIAILAVGGQGGGVLASWITDVAVRAGWHAQATSVAGVAQRTGATIYYVEMVRPDPARRGAKPVLALSPAPGDVDVVIAAELAEAGRATLRGFVSPERTTLIASSHRALAVSEKIVPGDGRADSSAMARGAAQAARRFIAFDMEELAKRAGSVVSASLFGALAGSGELPFDRKQFEAVIRAGGKGTEASLRAFAAAFEHVAPTRDAGVVPASGEVPAADTLPPPRSAAAAESVGATELSPTSPPEIAPEALDPAKGVRGPEQLGRAWRALLGRVAELPAPVREMAELGLAKVVDFLDPAYGAEYLDRLERAVTGDDAARGHVFSREAAKYLANAMVYDDIVRVADLKTRGSRTQRLRREAGVSENQTLLTTEYFHPRTAELSGLLPARLGAALVARPALVRQLDRFVDRGRRIRTDGLLGFGMLWAIAGLRRFRRGTLRHRHEAAHREEWLALALAERTGNYDLGTEILKCRRLIKGYSDTHARSLSKYDRVLSSLALLRGRADAADWLRRLREAALLDAEGRALDGALKTVGSFAQEPAG